MHPATLGMQNCDVPAVVFRPSATKSGRPYGVTHVSLSCRSPFPHLGPPWPHDLITWWGFALGLHAESAYTCCSWSSSLHHRDWWTEVNHVVHITWRLWLLDPRRAAPHQPAADLTSTYLTHHRRFLADMGLSEVWTSVVEGGGANFNPNIPLLRHLLFPKKKKQTGRNLGIGAFAIGSVLQHCGKSVLTHVFGYTWTSIVSYGGELNWPFET